MRMVVGLGIVASFFAPVAFAQETEAAAEEQTAQVAEPQEEAPSAVNQETINSRPTPESATLPERVARFRMIYGSAWGDKGRDKDGKEVDANVKVKASIGVLVFEYGATESLSLQFLMPYTFSNKLELNEKYFDSEFETGFNDGFEDTTGMTPAALPDTVAGQIVDGLATTLAPALTGGDKDACIALIENGTIKANHPALAALGGKLDFAAFAVAANSAPLGALVSTLSPENIEGDNTIKAADIASKFTNAVATYKAGARTLQHTAAKTAVNDTKIQTGIGDIEIGAKYAYSTVSNPLISGIPFYASVGLGVRLNTSGYADATKEGELPVGRGTTDYGLRLNFDYLPINGIALSVENQTEGQILKGTMYAGTQEVDYERVGMRQVGYGKVVVDPGVWVDVLKFMNLTGKYNYNLEAATKVDGTKQEADTVGKSQSFTSTLGLNGFPYNVPLQLDIDYTMPVGGKNVAVATSSLFTTLKAFYKF